MEMVGLVMVVVVLIIGIVVYVSMSSRVHVSNTPKMQPANSFLTALAETDIPVCDVSFSRVAQMCAQKKTLPSCDPCTALQLRVDFILDKTLRDEGRKYNLSLVGTTVGSENDCPSGASTTEVLSAPQLPIVFGDGRSAVLMLSFCR
jgi:hypothetical protein